MDMFTTILGGIGFFVVVMVGLGIAALTVVAVISAVKRYAIAINDWFES